jgi:hypothetical protein
LQTHATSETNSKSTAVEQTSLRGLTLSPPRRDATFSFERMTRFSPGGDIIVDLWMPTSANRRDYSFLVSHAASGKPMETSRRGLREECPHYPSALANLRFAFVPRAISKPREGMCERNFFGKYCARRHLLGIIRVVSARHFITPRVTTFASAPSSPLHPPSYVRTQARTADLRAGFRCTHSSVSRNRDHRGRGGRVSIG